MATTVAPPWHPPTSGGLVAVGLRRAAGSAHAASGGGAHTPQRVADTGVQGFSKSYPDVAMAMVTRPSTATSGGPSIVITSSATGSSATDIETSGSMMMMVMRVNPGERPHTRVSTGELGALWRCTARMRGIHTTILQPDGTTCAWVGRCALPEHCGEAAQAQDAVAGDAGSPMLTGGSPPTG